MEVIEERAERGSTLIATQLPVKQWHTAIGDPNHADALCDRVLHPSSPNHTQGCFASQNQNRTRDDHGGCMSTLVVAPVAEIRSETTERRLTYTSTLR